jgi:hypothetical protein
MDHGGRWPPMAAMVPTTQLQGIEILANMLCNKAMKLKLENLVIINTYYTTFGDAGGDL